MKFIFWVAFLIGFFVLSLFVVRLVLPSQVDDVNPLMNCSEKELGLGDVYFVVPKFSNVSIDKEWCEGILSRDKELALHGVYHSYNEFGVFRDEAYLDEGVRIFRECFGEEPERFKPPQLAWTSENDWIRDRLDVELFWNQVFHKVYHCGDSGVLPNWVVRVF